MTTTQPEPLMAVGQSYRDKILSLLGDREPIEVLAQTAARLAEIVRLHSGALLRTRAFEEGWTPNEIIGHLTDSEWVYGYRLRLVVSEDNPKIVCTNQDSWVSALRHNAREPSELVHLFETLREFNLTVWRRTTPADLKRIGQYDERGAESLGTMLRFVAGHDISHLDQIARTIQAVQD